VIPVSIPQSDVKFVLIGGGSFGWTHRLVTDIANLPTLHGMHIVLQDINPEALALTGPLCQRISDELEAGLTIETTTNLAGALPGADFVGLTISTAGEEGNHLDHAIPERHGVLQTVGDTVGPGGWSRALRNIPVVVDIIRQVERLAPNAWFMNYSNPMTVLTRAIQRTSAVKSVGLCHELQGFQLHAAYYLGVNWQHDIQVTMAGINHLIWILEMSVCAQDGLDLWRRYHLDPDHFEPLGPQEIDPELAHAGGVNPNQKVKLDLLERTGYISGAGDAHIAEFFSHYIQPETLERWGLATSRKAHTFAHETRLEKRKQGIEDLLAGRTQLWLDHSHEHASRIIDALVGGTQCLVTPVNTANIGQVDNLPRDVVLETQAAVNTTGIHPIPVGVLPEVLTQYLMRHIPTQEMIVEAGLTGNRELATLALANDPLVPDPDTARKIADDVFNEFADWLPQFNGKWSA
jgi:alpha-galactosidase/6-phospho-beta-glucosidase family protein